MDRGAVVCWLGRVPYREALELQHRWVSARAAGEAPDALLLVEHDPVVTLGRAFDGVRPAIPGVDVVEVERGGKATYHGPGQLVGYPILALGAGERDLHAYLRRIEEVLIAALARYGLEGEREAGATGVWIASELGRRKVASIGVAVKHWITFHGFAFNVSTDLRGFLGFDPCGFQSDVMTSLERSLGKAPALEEVGKVVSEEFARVFGRALAPASAREILGSRAEHR
jgi:lipoyl(octanoyl) transferase